MAMVSITQKELAYIAGFIDGEGCLTLDLGFSRKTLVFSARLIVVNTDKRIIKWLARKIGGGSCDMKRNPGKYHKPAYRFFLCAQSDLLKFLVEIYPYLRIKKRQARVLIGILKYRAKFFGFRPRNTIGKMELSALKKIRELNKKGCRP